MAAFDALPPEVRQVLRNLLYKPICPKVLTAVWKMSGVPAEVIAAIMAGEAIKTEARLVAELDGKFICQGSRSPHAAAQATILRAEPLTG
ncbi:hypothetical protein EOD42_14015 [Rhodovarius crocodyli]|uniref:Uncharacterized protein n=1 Tax=Rhodovarius crocodyli TaxID=1979269 RepID=A0A437MF32_9PROT|nr:hypothetical protein [Rhodovarius crocodyli]RVT96225.1 hypothetical protein EOD42_14015 [Rhodovarius crocodyli]